MVRNLIYSQENNWVLRMQSQITISGYRVREVGFRLNLLQYARKLKLFHFEAINDSNENEELVII